MPTSQAPMSQHPGAGPRRGGPVAVIALVLSLAALGLSSWTTWRAATHSSHASSYTDEQQAAAKAGICGAVDLVRRGVALNTNMASPGGAGDVTGSLAVAANARLSLFDGGQYLIARLDPAAPAQLAEATRTLANTLMDIGAAATAGAANTDSDQAARLHDADDESSRLAELCR